MALKKKPNPTKVEELNLQPSEIQVTTPSLDISSTTINLLRSGGTSGSGGHDASNTAANSGGAPVAANPIRANDLNFLLHTEYRDVSGFGNNLAHPTWGAANAHFVRITKSDFDDGISSIRQHAADGSLLTDERTISNVIFDQNTPNEPNPYGASLLLMSFGQFFDHGLDFLQRSTTDAPYVIPVKPGDELYGKAPFNGMFLTRGAAAPGTGTGTDADNPRQEINDTSPYVDQNQTYGSQGAVTYYLRQSVRDANGNLLHNADGTLVKSAHMVTSGTDAKGFVDLPTYKDILLNNGVSLAKINSALAHNSFAELAADPNFVDFRFGKVVDPWTHKQIDQPLLLDIAGDADPSGPGFHLSSLLSHYVAGDGRANENIMLTADHTIFFREHEYQVNRITDQVGNSWTQEQIFQTAKVVVEAEYQRIVFNEFAKALAGGITGKGEHGFGGYNPNVDASISLEFSQAAYRVGHSQINDTVPIADLAHGGTVTEDKLFDDFLNPARFKQIADTQGVSAIMLGQMEVAHQTIDTHFVDAVRNALVGLPLDLGSLNIARGREVGLESLNDVRKSLYDNGNLLGSHASDFSDNVKGNANYKPYADWADFGTHLRDPSLLPLFQQVYKSVNDVDLYVGGLAEKPVAGQLGSTFGYIFLEQLDRLQDGDRFYYLDRLKGTNLLDEIKNTTLADLIERDTGLANLNDHSFTVITPSSDHVFV